MNPATGIAFIELYRSNVEAVFRYHLIRGGDWRSAQLNTTKTFRSALTWFSPEVIQEGEAGVWLMGVAAFIRGRRTAHKEAEELTGELMPGQAQLAAFARAGQISDEWARLPRQEADGLAFHYFAGMDLERSARIVGLSGAALRRSAARHGAGEFFGLADNLRPVGFFIQNLEIDLNARLERTPGIAPSRVDWLVWRVGYRSRTGLVRLLRLVVVGLIIGLVIAALRAFNLATVPLSIGPQSSLHTGQIAPTFVLPPSRDELIAVDEFGRIGVFDLGFGDFTTRLSGIQFYPPDRMDPRYPAQISPDGMWLSVVRPAEGDTWLLPVARSEPPYQVSNKPVRLFWAPDGHAVNFIDPDQSWSLVQVDLKTRAGRNVKVTQLQNSNGEWLAAAWSPDSKLVAGIYRDQDYSPGGRRAYHFALIDPETSRGIELARLPPFSDFYYRNPHLEFTPDGREIWYPEARLGADVNSGEIRYLASQPFFPDFSRQALVPGVENPASGDDRRFISPDGQKVAILTRRLDTGSFGILSVNNGPNFEYQLWITYFGDIQAMSWTSDSASLILQRQEAAGAALMRVDVATGLSQRLGLNLWLLGERNQLRLDAWSTASHNDILLLDDTAGHGWKAISVPGGSFSLRVPGDWPFWKTGDAASMGAAATANFSFSDPKRLAELPDGRFILYFQETTFPDLSSLKESIQTLEESEESRTAVRQDNLPNGLSSLRWEFEGQGITRPMAAVQAGLRLLYIWMYPGIRSPADRILFDRILNSVTQTSRGL